MNINEGRKKEPPGGRELAVHEYSNEPTRWK